MTKKILFVHHTTALGGATNSMLFTLEALIKQNFEVKVLFLDKEGLASDLFRNKGIQVEHLEGIYNYQHAFGARIKWFGRNPIRPITQLFRMLFSVIKLKKYFTLNRSFIDIVHINTSVMLPVGIACKLLNLKVVWHNREIIYNGFLGIRKFLVSNIIKWSANRIIHISKIGEKSIGKSPNSEIIYNYIDLKKFDKNLTKFKIHDELGLSHQTKIITMLGGIVHSKGADVLIESIPQVIKEHHHNVHFLFVGYPPRTQNSNGNLKKNDMSNRCMKLINDNGIEKYITFLGLRNDIPEVLSSSHILVWPATVPHFSRPIIEAQAMGVPSIGTNFDVTNEVIEEGETGLTFKNGDAKSLGLQINRLISEQQLYEKISNQAFEQAKERFSAEKNIKKIIRIYNSFT
jgi:glycosyltransferase involved in cell wall biosynthesis